MFQKLKPGLRHNDRILRQIQNIAHEVVIASAVRTPAARYPNLSASRLATIAIDAAIKRATTPFTSVEALYLGSVHPLSSTAVTQEISNILNICEEEIKCFTVNEGQISGLKAIILGAQSVQQGQAEVVIAGGTQSLTDQNVLQNDTETIFEENGIEGHNPSESEIVPVVAKVQKKLITVSQDFKSHMSKDGAAVLTLTTSANANTMNIYPLAKILGYSLMNIQTLEQGYDTVRAFVESIGLPINRISIWEVNTATNGGLNFVKNLKPHCPTVNAHDIAAGLDGARMVTQLTHKLQSGDTGACLFTDQNNLALLLIQKLQASCSGIPVLTLYTKDPCPLCDKLIDELHTNFSGMFELQKVYINQKENVRYLRLYRHDIPVLFLNGQFLCMHTLNVRLLRERLNELQRITNLGQAG